MTELPTPDISTADAVVCLACSAVGHPGDVFCESCGADLPTSAPAGAVRASADAAEPAAITAELGTAHHDGTLLDDRTTAATDRSRNVQLLTADTDLAAVPTTCAACGGLVAADGYCGECGTAAPRVRDHFEDVPAPWLALVCDRGIRHARNEDAAAVAASRTGPGPGALGVMVVCDGVSMAPDSDRASLAAARAARDAMIAGLELPDPAGASSDSDADPQAPVGPAPAHDEGEPGADSAPPTDVGTALSTSRSGLLAQRIVLGAEAAQAQAAAAGADVPETRSPPSCTFVTGVLEHSADGSGLFVTGNVGDSRAYWFPDDGTPLLLTTDDSWAAEAIAHGVPREQAENLPQSHAITRWLGRDAPDAVPRTYVQVLDTSGWAIVCSDGLWNYASDPVALAEVVRTVLAESGNLPDVDAEPSPEAAAVAAPAGSAPVEGAPVEMVPVSLRLARGLVNWAIGKGGSDNITVAAARFDTGVPLVKEPELIENASAGDSDSESQR